MHSLKATFPLVIGIFTLLLSSCFPAQDNPETEMQIALPTGAPTQPAIPGASPTHLQPGLVSPLGGVHLHYPIQTAWIDSMVQAKLRWTRVELFFWDKIEPQKMDPPQYDWSQVDEQSLILLSSNGIRLIADILYAPEWAQKYPGVACGPIAEDEIDRFADFMHALVARYSQPPYNVKFWEIGNEPDIEHTLVSPRSGFGCWGDAEDPYYGGGYFAKVLKVVYPRVKEADPHAQILPGGLLMNCDPIHPPLDAYQKPLDCTPSLFLEGILKAGGGSAIDGISFHAYDYYDQALGQYSNPNWNSGWDSTGPAWISKVFYLRKILEEAGFSELPLFLTELATICGRDGSEEYCQTQALEQTKAIYAVQSLVEGKVNQLEAIIWYGVLGWRGSGMLEGGKWLPIYRAMEFFEAALSRAELARPLQEYAHVKGYVFQREDQEIWVLWSLDGKPHQIELPRIPIAIYNVVGQNMLEISDKVDVNISPTYIMMRAD